RSVRHSVRRGRRKPEIRLQHVILNVNPRLQLSKRNRLQVSRRGLQRRNLTVTISECKRHSYFSFGVSMSPPDAAGAFSITSARGRGGVFGLLRNAFPSLGCPNQCSG